MKYYVIAGEASGDLHGANLIKAIKRKDSIAEFRCWGGDLMKEQGCCVVKHYKDLAFMGFVEVLFNLKTILSNFKFCKKDIVFYKPDVVILIDYPGFNLKMASFVKQLNIPVYYYISPQIWAWKQGRVKKIKRIVDKMFVILPFEKDFYKKFNFDVEFVGHPLLDAMNDDCYKSEMIPFRNENNISDKKIIAILPGSRKQEILKMLPIMLSVVEHFPDYEFVIAGVSFLPKEMYENIILNKPVKIVYGKTYPLLYNSYAAIVTSGTATLETALFGVPEIVCYKGSNISFMLAKKLVKVNYISLVNLIANKEIVKELIQNDFNKERLIAELTKILENENREQMKSSFMELKKMLGSGSASDKTANIITNSLMFGK